MKILGNFLKFLTFYSKGSVPGRRYIIKVADLGMSKNIHNDVYYKTGGRAFAVKWASPEVLKYGKFSVKSDVWSFGVTLHEIFSYGTQPYLGLTNEEASQRVISGYRLPQPSQCPNEIYEIMRSCWHSNEAQRPNFREIFKGLKDIFDQEIESQIVVSGVHNIVENIEYN